jgi:hypothetical protein
MPLKAILTCAIAICISSAAIAAAKKHEHRGVSAPNSVAGQSGFRNPCDDPYAACAGGTYIGRDPDARVRARMISDFQSGAPNG